MRIALVVCLSLLAAVVLRLNVLLRSHRHLRELSLLKARMFLRGRSKREVEYARISNMILKKHRAAARGVRPHRRVCELRKFQTPSRSNTQAGDSLCRYELYQTPILKTTEILREIHPMTAESLPCAHRAVWWIIGL